ncbi:MAG: ROK family transcriptional regulator [Breznakibacter sp.]
MRYWDTEVINSVSGQERKKFLSKKQIIKFLYRHGILSSAELTNLIRLSTPTTLSYLNELVDEGYIENRGKGDSIGGRRPNMYGLVKNSVYVLGVEIGRKAIKIGLFNNELEKIAGVTHEVHNIPTEKEAVGLIYSMAQDMLGDNSPVFAKIIGVGITMPGLIDSEAGINYTYMHFGSTPLTELFSEKFKCPVVLENDAKARTLAEMKFGAAKGVPNAMLVLVEWGLGLGMILNGKLFKGQNGFSGEFSHIPIDPNGILCNCGKIGCLETMASGHALVRYTLEALSSNPNSLLYQYYQENASLITPRRIIEAAKMGDALAIAQISRIGAALGKGISYLIQILNPGVIILGGSVSNASEYLVTPLQQALYQYCLPQLRENIDLRISPLDSDANVLGAAAVLIEQALSS